jgi:hypothetical protein
MEGLIKMITDKTGISHEHATTAVNTVLTFVKQKLPPGVGDHLDSFIDNDNSKDAGSAGAGGLADNLKDKLGGLFGK